MLSAECLPVWVLSAVCLSECWVLTTYWHLLGKVLCLGPKTPLISSQDLSHYHQTHCTTAQQRLLIGAHTTILDSSVMIIINKIKSNHSYSALFKQKEELSMCNLPKDAIKSSLPDRLRPVTCETCGKLNMSTPLAESTSVGMHSGLWMQWWDHVTFAGNSRISAHQFVPLLLSSHWCDTDGLLSQQSVTGTDFITLTWSYLRDLIEQFVPACQQRPQVSTSQKL